MAGFWYPYASMADAQRRLCLLADRLANPACGVSFCDGRRIAVLRRPSGSAGIWLNVLVQHVAAPPPPPAPGGMRQKLERWCEKALEYMGEGQLQYEKAWDGTARAVMETAAYRATMKYFHDDVWLPVHQFMAQHKWVAPGVAVAADVIGVVAGGCLLIAAPEIIAAGTVLEVAGLATGLLAGGASVVLLAIDGDVFIAELSGNEAISRDIEEDATIQKIRIVATLCLLPDLAVGGTRAIVEFRALGNEAREGAAVTSRLDEQLAQRAKIYNPGRRNVQRARRGTRKLHTLAEKQRLEVERTHQKMGGIVRWDLGLVPASTLASERELDKDDLEVVKTMLSRCIPEGGMPKDVRLEIFIAGEKKLGHH